MTIEAPAAGAPGAAATTAAVDTSSAAATFGLTGAPAAGDDAAAQAAAAAAAAAVPPGEAPKPGDAPAPLALPGKDATPEQWAEFYGKIGRPEKPEGYELPVPEGDSGEFAKQVAPMLHKHGITADQAKGLAADWNAMAQSQQEAAAAAEVAQHAQQKAQNEAESQALKNEWGQAAEANMHFARQAVAQFLPKEQAADIIGAIESKVGYAATIKFLHSIGKGLAEGDAAGLGGNNAGVATKSLAERLYGGSGQ